MVYKGFRMRFFALAVTIACMPVAAQAYVGPGAGLGAIAVAVAVVLGLGLLIIGFLWYPLKRLLRGKGDTVHKDAPPRTED
jgi:hypothetical protein